jgi:predicted acyltransferase
MVAFLVLDKGWRAQAATAAGLLGVHWAAYVFLTGDVLGVPEITGPWDKNANLGWWLDGVILGKHWGGGYATINCVSSAANTIFGVMAGAWLRLHRDSIRPFLIWGAAGIVAGLLLDPLVPINKKIWTASFALISTGITLWTLALFIWLYDIRRGARPLSFAVVGMNSIFIYLFHEILHRPLWWGAMLALGWAIAPLGGWGKLLLECGLVALQIAVCWWLYGRKIFLKI